MERVNKGLMGGYSKAKDEITATHVVLTAEEYSKLLSDLRRAKEETQSTIAKANSEVAAYKKNAEEVIKQERDNAQKRIEAFQSDLKKSEVEIHRLNDLNANLLRISKERANAKRGLKPKKTHNGYLVLDSSQQNYIFRYWVNGKANTDEFSCWKVRIQSPYDSSISYSTITKNIHDDLVKVFGNSLGINSICDASKYKHSEFQEMWNSDKNFIFKTSYKSNYRNGLWEVEYLVRSDIKVPEDMRTE